MNVKDKKGSITIFVLVGLLFMSSFLLLSYANNINKSKIAKEQFNMISDIYSHKDGDANAYNRAYTALRKKKSQVLTKSSENSSSLELTKTFEGNLTNYRIFGNTNGIGNKVNLFDKSKYTIDEDGFILFNIGSEATNLIEGEKYTVSCNKPLKWFKISNEIGGWNSVQFDRDSDEFDDEIGGMKNIVFTMNRDSNIPQSDPQYMIISTKIEEGIYWIGEKDISAFDGYNIQIEKGNTATEYVPYGKYRIEVKVLNESGESKQYTILLDNPLYSGDYIDFKLGKVVRSDGTTESITSPELPEIKIFEDYTKIEVLAEGTPSKIEVEYEGYTFQ